MRGIPLAFATVNEAKGKVMKQSNDDGRRIQSFGARKARHLWVLIGLAAALPLSAQQVVVGGNPSGGPNSNVCSQAAGSVSYICLSQTVAGGTALINGVTSPTQPLDSAAQGTGAIAIGDPTTSAAYQGDIAIGAASQASGYGIGATAVGASASATNGGDTAVGSNAAASGGESVALGNGATATSARGVFIGANAGVGSLASGVDNVAVGSSAGQNINGYGNSSLGTRSGSNVVGAYNVGFGTDSGGSVTGTANTALGASAGFQVVGSQNLAAGIEAGSNLNGSNNVALGAFAGVGQPGATVNGTVALGANSVVGANEATAIGSSATANGAQSVALGYNAVASNPGSVAIGAGAVTAAAIPTAGTTLAGVSYQFAGANPTSVVSVGAAGAERQVTNVAAGQVSATSTDAVNGSQLYATNQAVTSLADGAAGPLRYSNSTTPTTPNGGAPTQNLTLVGAAPGAVALHNVAAGVAPTDAVDVQQMSTANSATLSSAEAYTNSRLMGLELQVGDLQRNADAGSASAMALSGVPQAFQPGKSMIAAGVGTYGSQSALALGLSTLSDDGRWVIKIDGSANTRGKYGGAVGAGLSW